MKDLIITKKDVLLRILLVIAGWVSYLITYSQEVQGSQLQTISLDEVTPLETVFLSSTMVNFSIDSRQKGELHIDFYGGGELLSSELWEVQYGVNIQTIDLLAVLGEAFLYDRKFKVEYRHDHRQNTRALFVSVKTPPIMPSPVIQLNMDELEVNCENPELGTSIACTASVAGGNAPYQLTWLISSSAEMVSLLADPVYSQLRNSEEVSRLTIEQSPDYYITLMVKDVCGNENKQTVYVQCMDSGEEHMLYFQNISIKEEATY